MRILVTGAGAVGGYFGARLIQAGRDVSFLVRSPRRQLLTGTGLVVRSPDGDVALTPQLITAGELQEPYDLVLLTVKSYGLDELIEDLRPAIGPETVIVPALNGMHHLDALQAAYGSKAIFGGVCVIAAQLDPDGSVRHLGLEPSWTYGELDGSLTERARRVDEILQVEGFRARLTDSIMIEMWEKWVFIGATAAATCLLRGSVGEIEAAGGVPIVNRIIDEASAVAAAAGYQPRAAT
ncbi:MAG: 2-dehydropantoate 2-reductase, partial [Microlunatus sp.]|nr:2-dehydropantoate 2-reductase [Microlunatus sp.]